KSVAYCGNMATVIHELIKMGFKPDILTDQTSAHDPLLGYIPEGYSLTQATELRKANPKDYLKKSKTSIAKHVRGMLHYQKPGAITFDYGNNIRAIALEE